MIKRIFRNSSNFLTQPQKSIFSAATLIMIMVAASRVLGLIRNRVLAHFFTAEVLSVYFAAFRLPEVIFEVLVFGSLSSAFIPTFTAYVSKKEKDQAWYVASVSLNFALICFLVLALVLLLFMQPLYKLIVPGFSASQLELVVRLARLLLLTQGFFIISYFLTGVLESLQRFLIPAIAPLFYNLGIIFGAVLFANRAGIYAPTVGAAIGAFFHFLIQLPLSLHLGFRPKLKLDLAHPGVKEIGRLAWPRIIELSFLQIGKSAELFLASLVSTAAYAYYTFANSLQLLPVGLFGTSLAKASLPSLSYHSANGDLSQFKKTFVLLFNEIIFLTLPFSVFLAVLRVPLVRLVFGAARFTWESTVQTGYTVSAFCLGISAQALIYLLTRTFYALHNTKLPVKISIATMFTNIILGIVFIVVLKLPIWSLALAFSVASIFQVILLLFSLKKYAGLSLKPLGAPCFKITVASFLSGGLMFFFLKVLDRSVWDKKLSFLGSLGLALPEEFNQFVLDTRYTLNLFLLTAIVGAIGFISYLVLVWLFKVEELSLLTKFFPSQSGPLDLIPEESV